MSGDSETVVGHIPVVAQLAIGIEQLVLFPTTTRIIVAHVGKRGAGALASSALLGRMSWGFEDFLKSGTESRRKRALPSLSPQQILAANKDNFSMSYGDIVRVSLIETPSTTLMTVLTKEDKFDFRATLGIDGIVELLNMPLGSKLSVEKIPVGLRPNRGR